MAHIKRWLRPHQRTLYKTMSYYVIHVLVAAGVAYVVTGNLIAALTLSLLEPTVQAFAFFLHEKAWQRRDKAATAQPRAPAPGQSAAAAMRRAAAATPA